MRSLVNVWLGVSSAYPTSTVLPGRISRACLAVHSGSRSGAENILLEYTSAIEAVDISLIAAGLCLLLRARVVESPFGKLGDSNAPSARLALRASLWSNSLWTSTLLALASESRPSHLAAGTLAVVSC